MVVWPLQVPIMFITICKLCYVGIQNLCGRTLQDIGLRLGRMSLMDLTEVFRNVSSSKADPTRKLSVSEHLCSWPAASIVSHSLTLWMLSSSVLQDLMLYLHRFIYRQEWTLKAHHCRMWRTYVVFWRTLQDIGLRLGSMSLMDFLPFQIHLIQENSGLTALLWRKCEIRAPVVHAG